MQLRTLTARLIAMLTFIVILSASIAPAAGAASQNNAELLRKEFKLVDGVMKVTADVRVESTEVVSLIALGYDSSGKLIEIKYQNELIFGGNTKVFQMDMDGGEQIANVDIRVQGSIEEPYQLLAESVVAKEDHLEATAAVKNGSNTQLVSVVATGLNKNGKVVEVTGQTELVFNDRTALYKLKLEAKDDIDTVKWTVIADNETYLVETGTYVKNGRLVFTSVVKNGEKTQKLMARMTPYTGNGKELPIITDTSLTFNNRLYKLRKEISDPSASQVAVQFYDETGKQEIVKRGIMVTIDGEALAAEQPPVNIEGNVLVPMRAIFEKLGASLEWDQASQTVTAVKGSKEIKLQIGSNVAQIDGQAYSLSVQPQLINGNTMVPVRFVSEALGCQVSWDSASQTVIITR